MNPQTVALIWADRSAFKSRKRYGGNDLPSEMIALESRIMLDGAAAVAAVAEAAESAEQNADNGAADNAATDPAANSESDARGDNSETADAGHSGPAESHSVVIVDASIRDPEALLTGIDPSAQIFYLTSGSDGVQQITNILAGLSNVTDLHILSHGSTGSVTLGATTLNASNIESYASQFVDWDVALADGADILLYGCNVGQNDAGMNFIDLFADLTNADVAASNNITGHETLGGDWDLELSTGAIQAQVAISEAAQAAFRARLVDITVTTATDENDGGAGGTGLSLREALVLAQNGDTIRFDASVFAVDDDITNNATINLSLGELVISQGVRIAGDIDGDGNADVTVDGASSSRVFNVAAGTADVALDGLVIQNGNASAGIGSGLLVNSGATVAVTGSSIINNYAGGYLGGYFTGYGGGIYNNGTLTVDNSTISGNGAYYDGGGIHHESGTATITNSTISGNSSGNDGAGIQSESTLTISNSTISGNIAIDDGGGIHHESGTAIITNATITGNSADDDGGGIRNFGDLTLTGSTVSGNTAGEDGGGIRNDVTMTVNNSTISNNTSLFGGGITNDGGLTLTNSTVNGNNAVIFGGGIDNRPGYGAATLAVINSTVSGNTAGFDGGGIINADILTLNNATISGNTANRGGGIFNYNGTITVTDSAVIGNTSYGRRAIFSILDGAGIFNYFGSATVTNSTISGNDAGYAGGGIVNLFGTATITNSTLNNNSARALGGGVFNNGDLSLENSIVSGNSTGGFGGGIYNAYGTTALSNSSITGNTATYTGGGVYNYSGSTTVTNSTISGNSASYGGGLSNNYGTTAITGSTISNNQANGAYYGGGGIINAGSLSLVNSTVSDNSSQVNGGGFFNFSGAATVINSTISGNAAGNQGGGIYNIATMELNNSTISGNRAGTSGGGLYNTNAAAVNNSIIAGNSAGASDNDVFGTATSNGANIFGSNVGFNTGGDIELGIGNTNTLADVFADVGTVTVGGASFTAGLLANNGGPVRTMALTQRGIAVDAGLDGVTVSPGDARGFLREVDIPGTGNDGPSLDIIDIGAFEVQGPPTAVDDAFTTNEDTVLTGNVLADNGNGADTDPNNVALVVRAETVNTANGAIVVLQADGSFTYTPAPGFTGADSFEYTIIGSDGNQDTGTVFITVNPTPADLPSTGNDGRQPSGDTTTNNGPGNGVDDLFAGDGPGFGNPIPILDGPSDFFPPTGNPFIDPTTTAGIGGTGTGGTFDPSGLPGTINLDPTSDSGSSDTDNTTGDATPLLTGEAPANSIVTITSSLGGVLGVVTADENGKWSFTAPPLSDGVHELIATSKDKDGKEGASLPLLATIDTIAPDTPPAPDYDGDIDQLKSNDTPTFSGTAEPGARIVLTSDPDGIVGEAIADENGNWQITTGPLSENSHTLNITATDTAGNTSSPSPALQLVVQPENDTALNFEPAPSDLAGLTAEDGSVGFDPIDLTALLRGFTAQVDASEIDQAASSVEKTLSTGFTRQLQKADNSAHILA